MRKLTLHFCTVLLATFSVSVIAETSWEDIDRMSQEMQPQVVEWRRWFHENPELSNREFKTSEKVASILRDMGLEVHTGIAKTGVIATIKGGKPGPLVALRADMDALPVAEETGLPFASTVTTEYNGNEVGVMHACGHDSHMAMLLGAAQLLMNMREDLPGSVMLIFQPAEEGAPEGEEGGAELMLKEGLFEDQKPAAVFGMHVGLNMPGGRIAVRSGPAMAAVDTFRVMVRGKQTHGSRPWGGIDPIVTASQIVLGLQTIASRQVDVTKAPSIITVGKIAGGIRHNIIPDDVELWGTIRTFDQGMREEIHQRIEHTAKTIAESAGARADVEITVGYPVTYNDPELTAQMMPTLEKVMGDQSVVEPALVTGAEDFSFFAQETPGVYLYLGAVAPDVDPRSAPSNHSPLFTIHEPIMETGVRAMAHMVVDYLEQAASL